MKLIWIGCLAAACVMALAPQVVTAAGGIYIEDLTVTNDGRVVFSDNFDDGSISDWEAVRDATVELQQTKPPNGVLHVNRQGDICCCAYHKVSIPRPGVVELSAWVFLPSVEEQSCYKTSASSFTGLSILSGSTDDSVAVDVELRPKEKGYRVQIHANTYETGKPCQAERRSTSSVVLTPGKWARLSLKMVFDGGSAFASLDGKELLSMSFLLEHYAPIKQAAIWGWLGDKPRSSDK